MTRHFVVALALAVLVSPAMADTPLTFNGRVLAGTCDVHADDVAKAVKLPPLRTDEVVGVVDAPVPASEMPFDLRFVNCRGVRRANLVFSGTSAQPGSPQYINNGDAQGVSLHLVEADTGKVIAATGFDASITVSGGTASYGAKAYYFRMGSQPVGQGLIDSTATVTVSYD